MKRTDTASDSLKITTVFQDDACPTPVIGRQQGECDFGPRKVSDVALLRACCQTYCDLSIILLELAIEAVYAGMNGALESCLIVGIGDSRMRTRTTAQNAREALT